MGHDAGAAQISIRDCLAQTPPLHVVVLGLLLLAFKHETYLYTCTW
jgi:hypothetical protein